MALRLGDWALEGYGEMGEWGDGSKKKISFKNVLTLLPSSTAHVPGGKNGGSRFSKALTSKFI